MPQIHKDLAVPDTVWCVQKYGTGDSKHTSPCFSTQCCPIKNFTVLAKIQKT